MHRAILAFLLLLNFANAASQGFDRNLYPGDEALPTLRKTFAFTGYWLNAPPGEASTSWIGKRLLLRKSGFGFLILFNGRVHQQLQGPGIANKLGTADGTLAASLARREDFPDHAIIFLDQEEGGRLTLEQLTYVLAWSDALTKSGYRAGIYCSGIPVRDSGDTITTAGDLHSHAGNREIHFFVYNDTCPPSPGCVFPRNSLNPQLSGVPFAEAWQIAQSPRRPKFTASCASTYSSTGLCLAPETKLDIDLSTATSPDPSHGR